ncbi:hypothetical protein OKW42_001052 [Paraburkholderia sp. WC7.3d]
MRATSAPVSSQLRRRSACTAGIAAEPGSIMPSVSAISAMVDAVPMTAHVPAVTASRPSTCLISCAETFPRAEIRPEAPAVRARAKPLAAMSPGHHWTGHHHCVGGPLRGDRTHQHRRHGFAASAERHHRIHRLGTNHFLDGHHRHQIAIDQRSRRKEDLAKRNHRKYDRQCARREHAALDRLDHFGKVAMAVIETALRGADPDGRLVERFAGVNHRFGKRPAQIAREVVITLVRQAIVQTTRFLIHFQILTFRRCSADIAKENVR